MPFVESQRLGVDANKSCDGIGDDSEDTGLLYSSSGCGGGVLHRDDDDSSPKCGDE